MSFKRWRLLSQQHSSRPGDEKRRGTEHDESQSSPPQDKQVPTDNLALNYKPAALKWHFLAVLTVAIAILMALIVIALATLPSTDGGWGLSRRENSGRPVGNFPSSSHTATVKPLDKYSEGSNRDDLWWAAWILRSGPWVSIGTQTITETNRRVTQYASHTTAPSRRPSQDTPTVRHKEHPVTGIPTETSVKPHSAVTITVVSQKTGMSEAPVAIHNSSGSTTETIASEPAKSESLSTHPLTSDVFETVKITVTNMVGDASAMRTSPGDDTSQPKENSPNSSFTVSTTTSDIPTRAATTWDSNSNYVSTFPLASIADIPRTTVVILDGTNTLTVAPTALPVQKEMLTETNTPEAILGTPAFVLLNSLGSAIATIDVIGPDSDSHTLESTVSFGITVSTITRPVLTLELVTSTILTTIDIATETCTFSPTKTMTTASNQPTETSDVTTSVYVITEWQYFVGMFLPTILSTSISIPIGVLERSIKLFHPFHALARPGGARAAESLLVEPGSHRQMLSSFFQRPFKDSFVLILVTALALAAVILTPFSSEAVSIQLHGCEEGTVEAGHCAITLGVSFFPSIATLALLAFMLFALLLIGLLLRSWNTGVASNPWSLCGIASLSTSPNLRRILSDVPADRKILRGKMGSRMFRIQHWESERGPQYGIRPIEDGPVEHFNGQSLLTTTQSTKHGAAQCHRPPLVMRYWVRGLCVVFLCGTLALIAYYESGVWVNSFEDFMDSESFGVQFLFTSIGVSVNIFWKAFFDSVAVLSPFRMLARGPTDARHSVLLAPPLDAFTGLWAGIRRKDGFLMTVAWCAVMSQFLPILLANVPAATVQTRTTNLVCSWMAVAVLGFMFLVLAGSFFVRWPRMPADPTTILGMMYYVCDSPPTGSFEGLSTLEEKERDRRARMMQSTYALDEIRGLSGIRRIAVYPVNDRDRSPALV
ncbi:hypothetical protein Hte_012080 [Hypoxylon texense]